MNQAGGVPDPTRHLRLLLILGTLGLFIALALVLLASPASLLIKAALVADLGLVVALLVAAGVYRLSFRLFRARRDQGDLALALTEGLAAGALSALSLALQLLRLLQPLTLALLAAALLAAQAVVFLRWANLASRRARRYNT